jgi:hypothetical protein
VEHANNKPASSKGAKAWQSLVRDERLAGLEVNPRIRTS